MGINEIGGVSTTLLANTRPQLQAKETAASSASVKNAQDGSANPENKGSQVKPEELKSAVEKIQSFVNISTSDLNFSIDDESGGTIIKVIDRSTKEVIRQIPSEEMLEMSQALDRLQGLLVKNQA